jgi:hypothetical protein
MRTGVRAVEADVVMLKQMFCKVLVFNHWPYVRLSIVGPPCTRDNSQCIRASLNLFAPLECALVGLKRTCVRQADAY